MKKQKQIQYNNFNTKQYAGLVYNNINTFSKIEFLSEFFKQGLWLTSAYNHNELNNQNLVLNLRSNN